MNDIERLMRIYGAAGSELRRMLLALEPLSYTDAKGMAVMVKARQLVSVLNFAVERWTSDAIPRAYAKGARTARTALEILGKKPVKPELHNAKRKIIDDTTLVLVRANNSIPVTVGRYIAITSEAARKAQYTQLQEFSFGQAEKTLGGYADEAVRAEQSRQTLAAKIREYLRTIIEDDEFIEIGGRMYRMKKYAEMVSRTTLRESQTKATLDLCGQYENDLVQWSDHETVCPICEQFEGKIYSLSGHHPVYPLLEEEPPVHPNCMHSLLPTSDLALEARRRFS